MNSVALYGRYIASSLRAQMLYPTAFLLRFTTQFVITLTGFGGLYAFFARFHHIGGWHFPEIALFYGIVSTSFSLAEMTSKGFDLFGAQFVKTGDFDRVLLRPRTATLQLAAFDFGFTTIGRLLQGLVALGVAFVLLDLHWTAAMAALLLWSIAGGVALFWAILVLQATLAFWTVESLEVVNALTYGGIEAAQYPLDIYAAWFRKFLIFIVPIGCVVYFPASVILGRTDITGAPAWIGALAPLAGFVFLSVAFAAWRHGVRHYTSTGS